MWSLKSDKELMYSPLLHSTFRDLIELESKAVEIELEAEEKRKVI